MKGTSEISPLRQKPYGDGDYGGGGDDDDDYGGGAGRDRPERLPSISGFKWCIFVTALVVLSFTLVWEFDEASSSDSEQSDNKVQLGGRTGRERGKGRQKGHGEPDMSLPPSPSPSPSSSPDITPESYVVLPGSEQDSENDNDNGNGNDTDTQSDFPEARQRHAALRWIQPHEFSLLMKPMASSSLDQHYDDHADLETFKIRSSLHEMKSKGRQELPPQDLRSRAVHTDAFLFRSSSSVKRQILHDAAAIENSANGGELFPVTTRSFSTVDLVSTLANHKDKGDEQAAEAEEAAEGGEREKEQRPTSTPAPTQNQHTEAHKDSKERDSSQDGTPATGSKPQPKSTPLHKPNKEDDRPNKEKEGGAISGNDLDPRDDGRNSHDDNKNSHDDGNDESKEDHKKQIEEEAESVEKSEAQGEASGKETGERLGIDHVAVLMHGGIGTIGEYYIDLNVGTPPQRFRAQVDTGSSSFIVPAEECSSCGKVIPMSSDMDSDSANINKRRYSYSSSTSSSIVPCNSDRCGTGTCGYLQCRSKTCDPDSHACCSADEPKACGFSLQYGGDSSYNVEAHGTLVVDSLSLRGYRDVGDSDRGAILLNRGRENIEVQLFNVTFYRTLEEKGPWPTQVESILGLGYPLLNCNPTCTPPAFESIPGAKSRFALCFGDEEGLALFGDDEFSSEVAELSVPWRSSLSFSTSSYADDSEGKGNSGEGESATPEHGRHHKKQGKDKRKGKTGKNDGETEVENDEGSSSDHSSGDRATVRGTAATNQEQNREEDQSSREEQNRNGSSESTKSKNKSKDRSNDDRRSDTTAHKREVNEKDIFWVPLVSGLFHTYYTIEMSRFTVGGIDLMKPDVKLPKRRKPIGWGEGGPGMNKYGMDTRKKMPPLRYGMDRREVILDSGTTLLLLQSDLWDRFVAFMKSEFCELPGVCEPSGESIFDAGVCLTRPPSLNFPTLRFTFDDSVTVTIPPELYFVRFLIDNEKHLYAHCLGIQSSGKSRSVIGNTFMRGVLTVFDRDQSRVGFALPNRNRCGRVWSLPSNKVQLTPYTARETLDPQFEQSKRNFFDFFGKILFWTVGVMFVIVLLLLLRWGCIALTRKVSASKPPKRYYRIN